MREGFFEEEKNLVLEIFIVRLTNFIKASEIKPRILYKTLTS